MEFFRFQSVFFFYHAQRLDEEKNACNLAGTVTMHNLVTHWSDFAISQMYCNAENRKKDEKNAIVLFV